MMHAVKGLAFLRMVCNSLYKISIMDGGVKAKNVAEKMD
jgi:hypothetical protein